MKPVVTYFNADVDKVNILAENRGKIGVYCWTNIINGNIYIGSCVNISSRMYTYYSLGSLVKSNSPIDRAMLKYGFSNFRLDVLEYSNRENVLEKEQYYMDLLKPIYNIVQKAGSTLGYKHTPESFIKMRSFVLSTEARNKKALTTVNATAAKRISITVEDINTNIKSEYTSLTEAGKALNISKAAISPSLLGNKV